MHLPLNLRYGPVILNVTYIRRRHARAPASLLYIWRHSNAMPKHWCALSSIPKGHGDTTTIVFSVYLMSERVHGNYRWQKLQSEASRWVCPQPWRISLHLKLIHSNPKGWWMTLTALSYLQWPSMDMLLLRCIIIVFWRSVVNNMDLSLGSCRDMPFCKTSEQG